MVAVGGVEAGNCPSTIGPVATAGFFCNGEIGSIGEKPFVHGFTSVIGLFTEPEPER